MSDLGSGGAVAVFSQRELIGDALIKLPFVCALRAAFPERRIVWITAGATHFQTSLAPLIPGVIDEFRSGTGWGMKRTDLLRPLPFADRFDTVIDTQTRWWLTLLLRRLPHRVFVSSTGGYALSSRVPSIGRKSPPHLVDRLFALIDAAAGHPVAMPDLRRIVVVPDEAAREAARLLPDGARYAAFAPGAGNREKCWPLDRFTVLARRAEGQGVVPVFLLGPEETEWREEIARAVPSAVFPLQAEGLAEPRYTPVRTVAVARRCAAAVAADCGLGHMIAAADTPLVSLFGPTDAAKLSPRVTRGAVIDARSFGGREMTRIPPDVVEAALFRLLV